MDPSTLTTADAPTLLQKSCGKCDMDTVLRDMLGEGSMANINKWYSSSVKGREQLRKLALGSAIDILPKLAEHLQGYFASGSMDLLNEDQ